MTTAYTSLLGLALPVTGELQGTWGDVVNDEITSLLDSAVAGTTTLSTDADVTLTDTDGVANQARQAIILWTANGTVTRNITAPATSKTYVVINKSAGTQSIVIRGSGPTTGVTILKDEQAVVAWNGSDFVKVSTFGGSPSFTNVTVTGTTTLSGLTASTALALNASKEVVSVTNTGTGNNVLATSPTVSGVTVSDGTANGVTYLNGSKVLTSGSALTFDGTSLGIGIASPSAILHTFGSGPIFERTTTATTSVRVASILRANSTGSAADGFGPYLEFQLTDAESTAAVLGGIAAVRAGADNTGNLVFFASSAGSNTEQMRLTSTGLGIGTSSPGAKLDVQGSATDFVAFNGLNTNNNASVATSSAIKFGFTSTVGTHYATLKITEDANNDNGGGLTIALPFGGVESTKLTLTSAGNLGLGVTPQAWSGGGVARAIQVSPYVALFSNGAGNTSSALTHNAYYDGTNWRYTNSSIGATRYEMTGPNAGSTHSWSVSAGGTAGNTISFTQAMTLDASGNLMAGGTTARGKVTFEYTQNSAADVWLRNNDSGSSSSCGYIVNAAGNSWRMGMGSTAKNSNALTWELDVSAPSTKMTLDTSGNLGLGVTPSNWPGQAANYDVLQLGIGAVANVADLHTEISYNQYVESGTGTRKYISTNPALFYRVGNTSHQWFTAPSGTAGNAISFTQAMTLDASGNLGIGTTSPEANGRLTLDRAGSNYLMLRSGGTNRMSLYVDSGVSVVDAQANPLAFSAGSAERARITSGGDVGIGTTSPTNTAGYTTLQIQGSTGGIFRLNNSGNTIQCYGGSDTAGGFIGSSTNHPFVFYTNGTERARITSGGDLLVGTTTGGNGSRFVRDASGGQVLEVNNNASSDPYGAVFTFSLSSPNNATNYFLRCSDNAGERLTVRSNGGIANYQANDANLSDRREKTNFAPAKSYLDTICSIPVQTFNYIDQSDDDPGLTLGVVAQDVQAVAPELVMESNWGTEDNPKMRLSIYQTDLQYALMKCIQEQQALIESLKARLDAANL